jgi:hypothetical protein
VRFVLGERELVERRRVLVRSSTAALAALFAAGAAARFLFVLGDPEQSWNGAPGAYLVPAAVALGAVLYLGAAWSSNRLALLVRRAGWVLMAAALLFPSTFSLALPLVAALAVTLARPTPERPSATRPESVPSN